MGSSLKAHWAQENRRRQQLPTEEILRLAAVQIERRLIWGKSGEKKPRLRIIDAKSPDGIRYVLLAGRYFIRARTWNRMLHRAAFGPWSKMAPQAKAGRNR